MSAVVSQHDSQQALRLNMDMSDAEQYAREGLQLQDLESLYPSEQTYMTPKMKEHLEVSLAALAASTPDLIPTPPPGAKKPETLGEALETVPAVKALGWVGHQIDDFLYSNGIDIYNLAAVPLNYLTVLLTGYNPGYSGQQLFDANLEVLNKAGIGPTPDEMRGGYPSYYKDIIGYDPGKVSVLGVPPGQASWNLQEIEEALNSIEETKLED
jgi:hypothetical protein